jgi:heat shock protein HslJ
MKTIGLLLGLAMAGSGFTYAQRVTMNTNWNISKLLIDGKIQNVQSFAYTMQLTDSTLSAKICNSFNGKVQIKADGTFLAQPMRSTKMMCAQMNHENGFIHAIQSAQFVRLNKGLLELLDKNKQLLLQAEKSAIQPGPVPPSMVDYGAMLDGTKYYVHELHDAFATTVVTESKAFLQFDLVNKRVAGKGGCNNFFAQAEIAFTANNSGNITISKAGSTMMACPQFMDTESRLLKLLEIVDNFEMNGGTLYLKKGKETMISLHSGS